MTVTEGQSENDPVVAGGGRCGAFTLVELLVAIAIVAMLLAMLVPSLSRGRLLAREARCGVQLRQLNIACMAYAAENKRWLPEVSADPQGNQSVGGSILYWMAGYWRDYLRETYGLPRNAMYSPSNSLWNRDDFYYHDTGRPGATYCVFGRFYFGGYDRLNTSGFRDHMVDPPADDGTPLFARRLGGASVYNWMWTDLNRQWPSGPEDWWLTPGDARRLGANHLDTKINWPRGSHVGYLDGHVGWTPGDAIELRVILSAEFYW